MSFGLLPTILLETVPFYAPFASISPTGNGDGEQAYTCGFSSTLLLLSPGEWLEVGLRMGMKSWQLCALCTDSPFLHLQSWHRGLFVHCG